MNRTDSPLPSQIKRARRSKKESSVQRAVQKLIGTAKMRLYELSDTVKPLLTDEKKRYAVYGAYIVAAFLCGFAALPGKIYPFGTAFLTSVCSKNVYFAYIGVSLSSFGCGDASLIQFLTYTMILFIRRSVSLGKFGESRKIRLIQTLCASVFTGLVRCAASFSFDSVVSSLVNIIISVCSCLLFSFLFSNDAKKVSQTSYALSLLTLCACIVTALERINIPSVSLSLIAACIITLIFAKSLGPVYSCAAGLICGFACGDPAISVALGLGGLGAGAVISASFASYAVFAAISGACAVYLSGLDALSGKVPEILAASILFIPLSHISAKIVRMPSSSKSVSKTLPALSKDEFDSMGDCLSGLSDIFSKLSEHFKYPDFTETSDIIDDGFAESCSSCSMNNMCYAKRQCDMDALYKKCAGILKNSPLDGGKFSAELFGKCIHAKDICSYINKEYSALAFNYLHSNRTRSLAGQYNAMSHLIKTTKQANRDSSARDTRLEKLISTALSKLGVVYGCVYVFGKRTKDIEVHEIRTDKIPCSSRELSEYLSRETGILFSEPSFDISDRADMIMRFNKASEIELEYAKTSSSKPDESVNGDTTAFFENKLGCFYSLISDGMGNGRQAAMTSRLTTIFMEKMLSAGAKKSVVLELLNNLLLSKNDETFSTVDLLEIDKLNSSAKFIKAGAAPSFILRGTKLYKISSSTPPAGIIRSFSAESTSFPLMDGDVIIMVSDGVIQSGDDALWLSEIIRIDTKDEPALLCAKIAEKARVINQRQDDMSVCIVKVNKRKAGEAYQSTSDLAS